MTGPAKVCTCDLDIPDKLCRKLQDFLIHFKGRNSPRKQQIRAYKRKALAIARVLKTNKEDIYKHGVF